MSFFWPLNGASQMLCTLVECDANRGETLVLLQYLNSPEAPKSSRLGNLCVYNAAVVRPS